MEIDNDTRKIILTFEEYEEKLSLANREIHPQIERLFMALRKMYTYLEDACLDEHADKELLLGLAEDVYNKFQFTYEECETLFLGRQMASERIAKRWKKRIEESDEKFFPGSHYLTDEQLIEIVKESHREKSDGK